MSLIKKYFIIWWIPIISYLIPILIFVFGNILKSDHIVDLALFIFLINILGNIISSIVQIINKKWFLMIPQILITIIVFLGLLIIYTFSPPDYYGVGKIIPQNIQIDYPIRRKANEDDLKEDNLILAAISQPGIYNYYTKYKPEEKGIFYIKVYEITTNDQLSTEEITHKSKTLVNDLNAKIHSGEFTIYEGSWGDEYGVRIELWFEPETSEGYKVSERNYIVEGWMR